MNLRDWLRQATQELAAAGVEAPRLEAEVLAAHALRRSRTYVLANPKSAAPDRTTLERRLAGEPLAYILGRREFFGRDFAVTPDVLIPRHETEVLVEAALEWIDDEGLKAVLDVGVGSGCVAISLALEQPDLSVDGVDISSAALQVAKANARSHDVGVRLFHSDLFESVDRTYDLVVSNPPYVALEADLPNDVRHEPAAALFAGSDGLDMYRRLAEESKAITPRILVEAGDDMREAIETVFLEAGWRNPRWMTDLDGNSRVGRIVAS